MTSLSITRMRGRQEGTEAAGLAPPIMITRGSEMPKSPPLATRNTLLASQQDRIPVRESRSGHRATHGGQMTGA